MGHRRILIDTSVIIDFLRKKNKQNSFLWKLKENNCRCFISIITVFELHVGAKTEQHKQDLLNLLKYFEIISFTYEIALLSANIYKKLKSENKLINFNDIFIGATAISINLPLTTLNEKHFNRLGVKIYKLT